MIAELFEAWGLGRWLEVEVGELFSELVDRIIVCSRRLLLAWLAHLGPLDLRNLELRGREVAVEHVDGTWW